MRHDFYTVIALLSFDDAQILTSVDPFGEFVRMERALTQLDHSAVTVTPAMKSRRPETNAMVTIVFICLTKAISLTYWSN